MTTFVGNILMLIVTATPVHYALDVPVQWSGNGHWYKAVFVGPSGISWSDAQNAALAEGGYLATITSAKENDFVYSLVSGEDYFWFMNSFGDGIGPWLGGYQYDELAEPAGHWRWTTSEAWQYTNWAYSEPNNFNTTENYLGFFGPGSLKGSLWNDFSNNGNQPNEFVRGYIVESVPEPSTFILLEMGAVSLIAFALRRRKR
jgi:hypothetical protein